MTSKAQAIRIVAKKMEYIARTGDYSDYQNVWNFAYENDVFLCECEDGIAVEDDFFRFQ